MAEETNVEVSVATEVECPQEDPEQLQGDYLSDDALVKHIQRQALIVAQSLQNRHEIPVSPRELGLAFERELFSPRVPPKQNENGTCEANPKLNFYPTFITPETLATYHIFFQNQKVPVSCRANRTRADALLMLSEGDAIPDYETMDVVSKIFEGLGDERLADERANNAERDSVLVELKGDNPRLAVLKRHLAITHFAYPAVHLPPKIITTVMDCLLTKRAQGAHLPDDIDPEEGKPVVSDEELSAWLKTKDPAKLEDQRKTMVAVILVSVLQECVRRFFSSPLVVRKIGETLHYAFNHGYVKLASKVANVELSNLVTYMGILHENRLGQSVLHKTLDGEAKRDYMRDTIFLMLVHTWQTAMGVWQQCLEDGNLKELVKILNKNRRSLWTGQSERVMAVELADIIFPSKLLSTLQAGLPDLISQSMMQNFRNFILERSGILPCLSNALPTDFVPIDYHESPPNLWVYVYLMKLANYFMFHSDVCHDTSGEGLMECYCRCNLCTPHRALATNTQLLNETQVIGTFDIRGPGADGQESSTGLKLTPGMWASAFLRKFEEKDYYPHKIAFYENQTGAPKVEPSACVITQSAILAQLQDIKKAREEFLLKKGHGVYLDPQTGEPLNAPDASVETGKVARKHERRSAAEKSANGAVQRDARVSGAVQRPGGRGELIQRGRGRAANCRRGAGGRSGRCNDCPNGRDPLTAAGCCSEFDSTKKQDAQSA